LGNVSEMTYFVSIGS